MKRFIDIGANLTDPMFSGIYNGSVKHQKDLENVLERCWKVGMSKIIITGGSLSDSRKAIEISQMDNRLFATVGCHPTRCCEFDELDQSNYFQHMKELIETNRNKVVALGEFGLDYDRVQFCPKEIQQKYFKLQLTLTEEFDLPLFVHCRNAANDLLEILKDFKCSGVVHSFDGTIEEAKNFIDLGYSIGINGCSLKTLDNLNTVADLPIDKILLESDCPYCEIRPTHAGYQFISKENILPSVKKEKWNPGCLVKSRNEPCNILHVLDVLASVKKIDSFKLCEQIFENTNKLFFKSYLVNAIVQISRPTIPFYSHSKDCYMYNGRRQEDIAISEFVSGYILLEGEQKYFQ
ncbi:putative deoxyribonuclease TATDN1 [Coccinella septempunctata]|uniref:putative deoxyribonuclease TATDN1 n=1 Tax=Coccinella septempunctata TaxID=41139 RepID=UPI001D094D61|nr:putative deoxyribonuclease TATDN1 [Coccinella septempunctata]